jgi:tRNA A-37 threonylcarbamoyl transferase component Bud32
VHVKVYRDLFASRARTSFHMGRALREAGVPTPEPLLLLWTGGLFRRSVLVCRALDSPVRLTDELKAGILGGASRRVLLEEVAGLAARLHGAGYFHADFTASNILLSGGRATLIDLDRAKDLRVLPEALARRIQVLDLRLLLLTTWAEVSRYSWLRLLARYRAARGISREQGQRLARRVLAARRGRIRPGATAPPMGGRIPWT